MEEASDPEEGDDGLSQAFLFFEEEIVSATEPIGDVFLNPEFFPKKVRALYKDLQERDLFLRQPKATREEGQPDTPALRYSVTCFVCDTISPANTSEAQPQMATVSRLFTGSSRATCGRKYEAWSLASTRISPQVVLT